MNGMGGHMDASLYHQIKWIKKVYKYKMDGAYEQGKMGLFHHLQDKRDLAIQKIRDRLSDRGK
jgi:hypothetical protein